MVLAMSDEPIIALLTEIRDLQRQHLQNYREAAARQQQALDAQKQAIRRSRSLLVTVGFIVVALYALPMFWWGSSWILRCALRR